MNISTEHAANACPTCGERLLAAYCSSCGEKRLGPADWKFSSIFHEAFSELANLEHSKLWQTLRLLLFRPGQLTRHYWNGRRKRFLGPLKLYFVFFALSLLLYSIHRPTAVYNVSTLVGAAPAGNLSRQLEQRASARGVPMAQIADEVSARWQKYISLSQVIYPIFVTLALLLLYRRRNFYFAHHLVFALHLLAFMFLSFSIMWPLHVAFGVEYSVEHFTSGYLLMTGASLLWTVVYLLLALRRVYADGWATSVLKSAIVFVIYFVASTFFLCATLILALMLT